MDPIVAALLEHGLTPGAMIALFAVLYWKKDQELKVERDARISDAKDFNALALKLQGQGLEQSQKLRETFDELRKLYPPRGGTLR